MPIKVEETGRSTKIVLNFGRINNQKQSDERDCGEEQSLSYDDSDLDRDSEDDLNSSIEDSGSVSLDQMKNVPVIVAPGSASS